MEPNYHQLWIFRAVARHGSFSRAAEELLISQPAVSAQVKELERTYGTPLFYQSGRRIHLTEAGQTLYHYAERAFALVQEAERALEGLKGLEQGHLIIAASTTPGIYLVPSLLGEYHQRYSGIQLTLEVGSTDETQSRLLNNHAKVGFVGRELLNESLLCQPFKPDRLMVVAPPGHPLARMEKVGLDEILREPFIMREPGSATRALTERELKELGVSLQVAMELGSPEAVKQAVAAGLGLAIVSEHSVSWEVAAGRLAVLKVGGLTLQRQLYLAYLKDKPMSPAARAFLELVEEEKREEDGGASIPL